MPRIVVLPLLLLAGCYRCQADTGGCEGTETLYVAPCAADMQAERFDAFLTGDPQPGAEVTLWGPLKHEAGMCTQLGCAWPGACCNSCGAWMGLSDSDNGGFFTVDDILLLGTIDDVDLACGGDESIQCCPLPTVGTDLAVTGTLVEFGSSVEGQQYAVEVSTICSPG